MTYQDFFAWNALTEFRKTATHKLVTKAQRVQMKVPQRQSTAHNNKNDTELLPNMKKAIRLKPTTSKIGQTKPIGNCNVESAACAKTRLRQCVLQSKEV